MVLPDALDASDDPEAARLVVAEPFSRCDASLAMTLDLEMRGLRPLRERVRTEPVMLAAEDAVVDDVGSFGLVFSPALSVLFVEDCELPLT